MNGETLLFKEWRIGQEIEYDSDIDGNKGGTDGSHQYKGTIEDLALDTNIIMIKKENDEFKQYQLNRIKIKFEDDGTNGYIGTNE